MSKLWFILALALVFTVTGCSDDDDDKTDDYAKKIEGTYTGTLKLGDETFPGTYDIKVNYKSVKIVTLEVNNITIDGVPITNITADCPVTLKDGKYNIAGTTTYSMAGVPVPLNIYISGTFDDAGNAVIPIEITTLQITVDFTGKKK